MEVTSDLDRDRGHGRSSTAGPVRDFNMWAPERPNDEGAVTAADPAAAILQSLRAIAGQKPVYAPTKVWAATITYDQLVAGQVTVDFPFQCHHLRIWNYITGWVYEVYSDTWTIGGASPANNPPVDIPIVEGTMKLIFRWQAPGSANQLAGGAGQIIKAQAFSRWLYGDM